MPSRQDRSYGVPTVTAFGTLLDRLLESAQTVKPTGAIEPALTRRDFADLLEQVSSIFTDVEVRPAEGAESRKKTRQFAAIETAARDVFSGLIVS